MSPMNRGSVGRSGWVVRSCKCVLMTAAMCLVALGSSGKSAHADLLGYYSFNSNANDFSGNNYHATLQGAASITNDDPMLGAGALLNAASSRANVPAFDSADEAPLLNADFTNFSVGLWMKPDNWGASGNQWIAGKGVTAGATTAGWRIFKNATTVTFQAWGSGTGNGTQLTTATHIAGVNGVNNAEDYIHYVTTFESTGATSSIMKTYVNGILQIQTPLANQGVIAGANDRNFQIGSVNDGASFLGRIDDVVLLSDTATPEAIALTHGLGRLAGVNYSTPIADVLAAYLGQGSAVAGGATWYYQSDVGAPGNGDGVVGTIGGSLANNDAFIVLSETGAGVSIVPEPSCFLMAGLGLAGVVCLYRRRRK